jgi:hypothetical protein
VTAGSVVAILGVGAAASGCGGERQDAHEPSGTFSVQVVKATFPTSQAIAQPQTMTIQVRNADSRQIPNIGVTVESFTHLATQTGLADRRRPIWIVDEPPKGGDVVQNDTWALGPLAPGATRTFVWHVTAIDPGVHTVRYRVVAGLNGKARAQLEGGAVPEGTFKVTVIGKPLSARVDPTTGKVVRSQKPVD